jgi:hypothetical protein
MPTDEREFPLSYDRTAKVISSLVLALLAVLCVSLQTPVVVGISVVIAVVAYAYAPRGYAISEGSIVAVGQELKQVMKELLQRMVQQDHALITLYSGSGVEQAEGIKQELEQAYPDIDIELHYGGQPLYHFIVSVE